MTPEYFEKWLQPLKEPRRPLTSAEAERRHDAALPYVAVFEHGGGRIVVEWLRDWVFVDFLDERLRFRESYHFGRASDGSTFLGLAKIIEYKGDTDEVRYSFINGIREDGSVVTDFRSDNEATETDWKLDSHLLKAELPKFGDYDALIRRAEEVRELFAEQKA